MVRNTLVAVISGALLIAAGAAQAQDKTRAEVKAETRAAGVNGSASAEAPTPGGKVVGGKSRAQVKASRGAVHGSESADTAEPVKKSNSGTTRAEVKSTVGKDTGSKPVDYPLPPSKKKK